MSEYKHNQLQKNSQTVEEFCSKYGFKVVPLNHGYQLRIEEILDVYPVRQRWHFLVDNSRGGWTDLESLRKIMLKKLQSPEIATDGEVSPRPPMPFVPRPYQKEVIDKILRMSPEERAKGLQWGRPRYVSGIDFAAPNSKDRTVVSTMKLDGKGGITKIWFDEFSDWPTYKWWRTPIKWYRWRRTMKLLDRNQTKNIKRQSTPPGDFELPKYNAIYKKDK